MPTQFEPYSAPCKSEYKASYHGGLRSVHAITLIVEHATQGGTALSNAKYFAEPKTPDSGPGGSAHLTVDENECYRCLPNNIIAYAAPGANSQGFHIEQCGFSSWNPLTWMKHYRTLNRAAYKTAVHCHLFRIPPVFIFAADIRASKKGVTTHAEVTKAFPNIGDHTDPGLFWPRRYFMRRVRTYYAQIPI